jgi:hypothetical protein
MNTDLDQPRQEAGSSCGRTSLFVHVQPVI